MPHSTAPCPQPGPDAGSAPPWLRPDSQQPISAQEAAAGVVFRTSTIECLYHDRGSETLFVTFNEMGMRANGRDCWAQAPAQNLNISIFGFVSTQPNWFPIADMLLCLHAFWACTWTSQHKRVVVLGLSQGGYAALKFRRMLGADISIAFSPQISIDPGDIVDQRFNSYFDNSMHHAMKVQSRDLSPSCFLLYDPYDRLDAKHCRMLQDLGDVTLVPLPFVGHRSVAVFQGTENLRKLVEACFARDLVRIRAQYAELKRHNSDRPSLVALAAVDKHPRVVLKIFEKYNKVGSQKIWPHICWRLSEAGFGAGVLGWLQEFIRVNPANHTAREIYCRVAIRMGMRDLAISQAEYLLRVDVDTPRRQALLAAAQQMHLDRSELAVGPETIRGTKTENSISMRSSFQGADHVQTPLNRV